jgi:hypothetical protein
VLATDNVILRSNYKVFLIQGGSGVKKEAEEAVKQTCSFKWVPLQSLRFALNYLFTDSYSGKIFERHFFKYLYLKVTKRFSQSGIGTLGEPKTPESGLVATL